MASESPGFRTDYSPMQRYAPTGSLLNKLGSQLNSLTPAISSSHANGSGLGNRDIGDPPMIIGVAQITDNSDTQCQNLDEAPCGSSGRYLAKFRYWDQSAKTWQNNPNVLLKIDASVCLPSTPRYEVGDMVPAMFDSNKLWCVPLQSPPQEMPFVSFICSDPGNSGVRRSTDEIPELNNATQISVWILDENNERAEPYGAQAPDLVLVPNGRGQAVGGSNTILTVLSDGDRIEMHAGTSAFTRIDMRVSICGIAIRWIGKAKDGDYMPGLIAERDTFKTMGPWDLYSSNHVGRFGCPSISTGGPITSQSNQLQVSTQTPGEEWEAEITYWAEVIQDTVHGFVQIAIPSESPGDSGLELGQPVDPNDEDMFDAIVIKNIDTFNQKVIKESAGEPTQRCWLLFIDRYDDPGMTGEDAKSIGEQGLIYGPCVPCGSFGDGPNARPVYMCMRPEEEYICIAETQNGTAAKGTTETFILKDGKGRTSNVKRQALVKWNALNRKKEAIMTRFQQQRIVNQVECG